MERLLRRWQWLTHTGALAWQAGCGMGRLKPSSWSAVYLPYILEMEFLSRQDCSVACDKGLLVMSGKTIQCTDRIGHLLANKVQIIRTLILPLDREVHVGCRLISEPSAPVELIEGSLSGESGGAVTATLYRPRTKREVTVRCIDLGMEPRELKTGTIIGIYQPVEEN